MAALMSRRPSASMSLAYLRVIELLPNLAYEAEHLDLRAGDQKRPEYLALNSNGYVPTLVHDDFVVCESIVICEYVDDAFPNRPRLPGHHAAADCSCRVRLIRPQDLDRASLSRTAAAMPEGQLADGSILVPMHRGDKGELAVVLRGGASTLPTAARYPRQW